MKKKQIIITLDEPNKFRVKTTGVSNLEIIGIFELIKADVLKNYAK